MTRTLENSDVRVGMGDIAVANEGTLSALLGSCIGLVLYNQSRGIGGLAHVVLPESHGRTQPAGKYMDSAIDCLLPQVADGDNTIVIAKITGGADMFQSNSEATIGAQNIAAANKLLGEMGIPLVASHCGGQLGRRMLFDLETGKVTVKQVGVDQEVTL